VPCTPHPRTAGQAYQIEQCCFEHRAGGKQRRLSDKRVDDLSAIGKMPQVRLWPGMRLVCLDVGEGTPVMLDDPLLHQWLDKIFPE